MKCLSFKQPVPELILSGIKAIENRNWNTIGWGDGFYVWPDPYDDNIVYGQWQGGNLYKKYLNT